MAGSAPTEGQATSCFSAWISCGCRSSAWASTGSVIVCLLSGYAAVDTEDLAGDPACLVRGQEGRCGGDVFGFSQHARMNPPQQLGLSLFAVGVPLPARGRVGQDEAGRDGIDRDAVLA